MKVKTIISILEAEKWYLDRTKGSHRQYKHPQKKGLVTVSGGLNEDVPRGTLNSISKQADIHLKFK